MELAALTNTANTAGMVGHLGIPAHLQNFEPTLQAAFSRLEAVQPDRYSRTRNALDGAVTGLSPYLTHGMLGMQAAANFVHQRYSLGFEDKLVFEFGWREFFQHVWGTAAKGGDAILDDMHGSLPSPGIYSHTLPQDIREARTGVPAIDASVRTLYATGYLHNHARMWLASYVVHLRKIHWRAGADWLYGHLLDGDLASNHLSWQWVAGTFSSKPYLFNADNVLKFAPAAARDAWSSPHTVIDQSYEALDVMARSSRAAGPERGQHAGMAEPVLHSAGLASFMPLAQAESAQEAINNIANKCIELIHPWNLSPRRGDAVRLGVIHLPAHTAWPWSERRWRFVLGAMREVTDAIWLGDLHQLELSGAVDVSAQATLFPGYRDTLAAVARLTPQPRLFPEPRMACRSFSKFYGRVQQGVGQFADLL